MGTFTRLGPAILSLAAALSISHFSMSEGEAGVEVRPGIWIHDAAAEQLDLGRWAVRRFEAAGLEAPVVEIHFHGEAAACEGHLGYAKLARVDVCTTLVNSMTRRTILHEMGHIWLDANTTPSERVRFLEFRGLRSWNDSNDPWQLRGYEQGAEIMSWGLGERILTAQIPNNEPELLTPAFELLTGVPLPGSA